MSFTSLIVEPFASEDTNAELHIFVLENKEIKEHIIKKEGGTLMFPEGIDFDPANTSYIKEFRMYAYDQTIESGSHFQIYIPYETIPDKDNCIQIKIIEILPDPWFVMQQTNKPKMDKI